MWLPPNWSKTVVLIEQKELDEQERDDGVDEHAVPHGDGACLVGDQLDEQGRDVWRPVGTGFLFDYKGLNCLATAKHVIAENNQPREDIYITFNQKPSGVRRYPVKRVAKQYGVSWHYVEDLALSLFGIDVDRDDLLKLPNELFESPDNVFVGDDIFS